jgi:hypothetical protein
MKHDVLRDRIDLVAPEIPFRHLATYAGLSLDPAKMAIGASEHLPFESPRANVKA